METKSDKGYVYLIKQGDYLKIGYTANLERRIKQYQTHNPDCFVFACIRGDSSIETALHKLFSKYKYKSEWFYENDEIYDFFLEYGERYYLENNFIFINKDTLESHSENIKSLVDFKLFFFGIYASYVENKCLIFDIRNRFFKREIEKKLKLSKQNIHRSLKSLVNLDFIEKLDEHRYKINPKIARYKKDKRKIILRS